MRKVFLDLSDNEARQKANLSKLSERRDILSQNLFTNIVRNESHELTNLLPAKLDHVKNLRKPRMFQNITCRTDRYKKSFIIHYSDNYDRY